MALFRKYKTYINNKLYIPMIYSNGAFHYFSTNIWKYGNTNFFTVDNETFMTADGKVFKVIVPKNDAVAGSGTVGLTIVG